MNKALVVKALGLFLVLLSLAMLIPVGVGFYYAESAAEAFLIAATVTILVGVSLSLLFRRSSGRMHSRDAFLLVAAAWLSVTIAGALPFYLSGVYSTFIDAWFESVSGFTTTGATVIAEIESLPRCILLWRSLSQYLGGMGIIVLSLAVLPLLGVGGMQLYRAEAPGPSSDKISSRVSETARALWVVYIAFAVIETIVLCLLGMDLFDAVNHAMTTMATGGFSTKNQSIGYFNSVGIDAVITLFMFFAGVNFLLHYRFFVRKDMGVFKSAELRFYFVLVSVSILSLTFYLWNVDYSDFAEAIRYASFQVVSIVTTTGFGTADFALWGPFAHVLIMLLMVVGGCAGSTAGGIKCVRAMMLIKQGFRELYLLVHPNAVSPLKVDGRNVSGNMSSAIFGYFFLYVLLLAGTSLFISLAGVDIVTSVSATLSALSNVGPGLGEVGPVLNYGNLPQAAKVLLSCCMIIGRLEIFTILVLFTSEYWQS